MAFDTFLKFTPELKTDSLRDQHVGEIEIYSFSWGASNPTTVGAGTGLSAGKVSVSSFNIMKKTDSASPSLFQKCCEGGHFDSATVTMMKASGDSKAPISFLVYDFTYVMVESIQWSGSSGGDDTPTESVSLSFAAVKVTYTPQAMKGGAAPQPVVAKWDLTKVVAS
jgi:type VI secretion system secreted protein Hcp